MVGISTRRIQARFPSRTSTCSRHPRKRRGRALVEVSDQGAVLRFLPTGETEPLLGLWIRQFAAKWILMPAQAGGRPVACWMVLDSTIDYTLDSAKKKSERILKKNLRAIPK